MTGMKFDVAMSSGAPADATTAAVASTDTDTLLLLLESLNHMIPEN
jgi:hypothetical protein